MTHEHSQLFTPPPSPSSEDSSRRPFSPATLHNHLNNLSTMAAQTPQNEEDYSLFLSENGHISYENPNYHLHPMTIDPDRLDDHLNSNVLQPVSVFEELRLEAVAAQKRGVSSRKGYASLDVATMGVDVHEGPKTTLDNKILEEGSSKDPSVLQHESEIESDKLVESASEKAEKSDGEVDTSEVIKRRVKKKRSGRNSVGEDLPPGWERHEDAEGSYFWHVKSGTIQRDAPARVEEDERKPSTVVRDARSSRIFDDDFDVKQAMTKSCTVNSIVDLSKEKSSATAEKRWKRNSMPPARTDSAEDASNLSMQVPVHSLGSVELREEELTPENSSKAVNRCIVQLSTAAAAPEASSGRWGDGKALTLELNEGSLKLIQPETGLMLNSQPIHSIRVWGVGRDNGQDFAYVARDKHTRRHMCHVFRCEMQARAIANALRDICKKILIERSLAQSSTRLSLAAQGGLQHPPQQVQQQKSTVRKDSRLRPTHFNCKLQTKTVPAPESFPTPMEEPRKVLKGWFLGTLQVNKPCGMEVINAAIDELMNSVPRAEWKTVAVAVAPSTVTISFNEGGGGGGGSSSLDCRVRFLSFLGIGENPQQCAFIMHTAQDTFMAHVFHCEPTAGPLCKTIEAACKLRYQKCLDARPQRKQHGGAASAAAAGMQQAASASIGSTLKSMFRFASKGGKQQQQNPS